MQFSDSKIYSYSGAMVFKLLCNWFEGDIDFLAWNFPYLKGKKVEKKSTNTKHKLYIFFHISHNLYPFGFSFTDRLWGNIEKKLICVSVTIEYFSFFKSSTSFLTQKSFSLKVLLKNEAGKQFVLIISTTKSSLLEAF